MGIEVSYSFISVSFGGNPTVFLVISSESTRPPGYCETQILRVNILDLRDARPFVSCIVNSSASCPRDDWSHSGQTKSLQLGPSTRHFLSSRWHPVKVGEILSSQHLELSFLAVVKPTVRLEAHSPGRRKYNLITHSIHSLFWYHLARFNPSTCYWLNKGDTRRKRKTSPVHSLQQLKL